MENLVNQRQALLNFANTDPYARIDVAGGKHRHLECEFVIGCVAGRAARIEAASRGAPDIAAGAELAGVRGTQHAGAHRAILQRGGVVVEFNQARETAADFGKQSLHLRGAFGRDIAGDTSGHDRVHHQSMTEASFRCAQYTLAQDAALRMHHRERSIVADGADIAEMIGQPLDFRHQCAQVGRARRRGQLQCGFGGLRKRKGIGDRAVTRSAGGQFRRIVESSAGHQQLDALVHVAEPLLEAHHMFAVGGEAEMSRFDDAGMHGTDRNLVQAFAFGGEESVGSSLPAIPHAVIEPGSRVGRTHGVKLEQIAYRAFQPQRWRMLGADAGIFSVRAGVSQHRDIAGAFVQ